MKAVKEIAFFFIFIVIVQVLIVRVWPPTINRDVVRFERIMKNPPDVLLFGDSSVRTFSPRDKDRRSIDAYVKNFLRNTRIVSIDHPAYDAGIYEAYVTSLVAKKNVPKYVVIPINLREFSPDWDNRPEYQFTTEQVYLRFGHTPLYPFLPFLLNIKAFPNLERSYDAFYTTPVYDGTRFLGIEKDFDNSSFKEVTLQHNIQKVQLYYLYRLPGSHRKIRSLQTIQTLLAKRGVVCVFYITPINYEYASRFVGNRAKSQISENVRVIKDALAKVDGEVIDLTFSLYDNQFAHDADYIDEHLNSVGRTFVAKKIAQAISEKH